MSRYASLDDLNYDLDHEGMAGEDDSLDEDDLALLTPPPRSASAKPAPAKKRTAARPKKKAT